MDAHGTADEQRPDRVRQPYEGMLRELRQDLGCTKDRLIKYPRLIRALESRAVAMGNASIESCIAALKSLIEELSNPKHRGALLAALRLDSRFQEITVTARRESYNKMLLESDDPAERDLGVDNIRTLERRENEGIKIIDGYLNGDYSGEIEVSGRLVAETSSRSVLDGISTVAAAFTYYFSDRGVIVKEDVTRLVRAVRANSGRRVSWSHEYYSENRRGVLDFHADFGCRLVDSTEVDNGAVMAKFELPRQLDPDDGPYAIGYHLLVNSDRRCDSIVTWRSGKGSKRVEFRLVFDRCMRPLRAWWFIDRHGVRPRIEPDESEGRHLEVLDTGDSIYVFKMFESEELSHDMPHGVCWTWDE